MSNNSISAGFNNIQQTLAIHKEIAQGAIMPSIDGHTPQVVSFGSLMKQKLQEINQDQLTSSMLTQAVDSAGAMIWWAPWWRLKRPVCRFRLDAGA